MKELSTCLALVHDIPNDQRDELLERVDRYRAAGMSAGDAQRAAVADLSAENDDELAELQQLARAQHADVFMPEELVTERRSRFFTMPDEYEAVQLSRRQGVDRGLEQWAAKVMAGDDPGRDKVMLAERTPHPALEMAGMARSRPVLLPANTIRHLDNKGRIDTGLITPADIGALPDLMQRPRAVLRYATFKAGARVEGYRMVLDARDPQGRPILLGLLPDITTVQRQPIKVTDIRTLFGADDSMALVLRALRDGEVVWMREEEVARVRDFTSGGSIPHALGAGPATRTSEGAPPRTALAAPQPLQGAKVSRTTSTASVYTDDALSRYMAGDRGWQTARVQLAVSEADIGRAVQEGIAFSRRQSPPPAAAPARPPQFNLREFGRVAQVIEGIQDRYNRWKQAIQDVRKQGGTVTEANDFYAAEERYWGIVGTEIEDFGKEVAEFTEAVAKDKLTLEDVATYAYAQHAKERNAYIAARRPGMPDGGSGMTNDEAQAFLDDAAFAGLDTKLQRHADTLRRWSERTRDMMRDRGLITPDEHAAWSAMFTSYVPLRGLDGATERKGTGQGFNIRGAESKRAMGRRSEAKQIIEQIIQDRSRVAIRAGKNSVLRSFLQFVLDNPSRNLWQVNAVETKPVERVDAMGNRVIEEDQRVISDDRTVTVKDGGREVHILVRDERLRTQLQNLHVEQVGRWLGGLLLANRVMGKLYTAFSPVFTVINGARDLQAASMGIIDEIGFMGVPRLWVKMPRAIVSAYANELGRPSTDFQLYRATGGKTGFFDFKDLDRQTAELREMLANAERSWVHPRKVWGKMAALIDGLNGGIENATRFASFQVARESGMTTAEAARVSKNITVNFNRKGALTPALSAWFLFFNPAVQGTARMLQALRSPKVLSALGVGMTGIAALALRNAAMGEDDDGIPWWDKIPDEVKERNLIIMLPPGATEGEEVPGSRVGRYVKVPMPYGYNFFAVVANQAVDVWRNTLNANHGRSPVRAMAKAFNAFAGALLPASELSTGVENSEALVMLGVPDAFNPLAQGALNLNSFGRKMYPDDRASESLPDSQRYFAGQAGTIFQRAAERLNTMSGGSRFEPGLFDISPAQLENLARGYGGGPVSFGLDVLNAIYVRQSIERPVLATRKLPFVKQLYGVIDAESDRLVGYERLDEVEKKAARVERARKEGDREAALEMREEYGAISQIGKAAENTREQLANLRKLELKVLAKAGWSEAERYAKLVETNEKRRLALQAFNHVYGRALSIDAQREK